MLPERGVMWWKVGGDNDGGVAKRIEGEYCTYKDITSRTFAYVTLKERMPKVLTQVIDTIHREERSVASQFGEVSKLSLPLHIQYLPVSSCCKWARAFTVIYVRQAAEKS